MSPKQVAILYRHALFAQSIACLLEAEPQLQIVHLDADRADAAEELRRLHPSVTIVEHDGDPTAPNGVLLDLLDGVGPSLLILLGLRAEGMHVLYGHRVAPATPDRLLEVVQEGCR